MGDLAVIVAFIEARLAEDKQRVESLLFACKIPEKTPDFFACGGPAAEAYWEHFGPARMLRDVEAVRRILERHRDCYPYGGGPCDHAGLVAFDERPCPDLRDLAARWSDHPEYQERWKP
jgi:hypothetical protein